MITINERISKIKDQLLKNRKIAELLGLKGTPAFIIGDIIYPGAVDQKTVPIQDQYITNHGLYKSIQLKDSARFSAFNIIPNAAHFNVIENPEACASAVYNFINTLNN